MEAIEAIMTRRSIRKYTDEEVTNDQVEVILRAAMAAPSAVNKQPWHFLVIRDREKLDSIKSFHPFAWMAKKAPIAILVCGDFTLDKVIGFVEEDCSAATQNMLLAAHATGLGAVWCGISQGGKRVETYQRKFDLPDHFRPISLVVLGHPAKTKKPANRFKPQYISYNSYGA
jgi:nitroreductase